MSAGEETRRILVIDDEADFCRLVQDYLGGRGYQVETARDGLEGFQRATRERFDLIIADVNMPGMNGVEALRSLQMVKSPAKMVVISGYLTDDMARDCREAGAAAVLAKPVEFPHVAEVVAELLGKGD